jgi:PAS domain-containing protein
VLAEDVRRLDADRAAARLAGHGRVEREAGGGPGRRDFQPAHLVLLAEAHVAPDLEAELLDVEGEGRVLVGDGEHRHAEVGDGGGGLGEIAHVSSDPAGGGKSSVGAARRCLRGRGVVG